MPNTKSAKKTLRQSKRRQERNIIRRKNIKTTAKKIRKFTEAGNQKEALKLIPEAYRAIDKAVKRKILKKNTANRKKSRLTRLASKKTT